MAGVLWGTRDPTTEPRAGSLKETRFEWIEPLTEKMRTGILLDEEVPFVRVGAFVWPKEAPQIGLRRKSSNTTLPNGQEQTVPVKPGTSLANEVIPESPTCDPPSVDPDVEALSARVPVVGMFMHGGGYCHMSAEEKSSTSRIPRRLMQDGNFTEIYSVEYRLLQYAPFPAAVQDAAAVYAHIMKLYETPKGGKGCKVILMGDSSGGNLVLSVTRWIRDEGHLPMPDGLLLLSPSCDPSHAFPLTPSAYIPRPHDATDYLVDTPEPRALLQRTFLGHHPMEMIHSPYVSPASERVLRGFYGDDTWEKIAKTVGVHINEYAEAHFKRLQEEARALAAELERAPTPASSKRSLDLLRPSPKPPSLLPSYCHSNPDLRLLRQISMVNPKSLSLFQNFPRTSIVLGDAERLESEVLKLVGAMEHDKVKVKLIGAKDAVHDILIMKWWDDAIREEVWKNVDDWVKMIQAD